MTVEDVKQSVRIDELAREAGYKLTRGGVNEVMCLCPNPSHSDTNASCSINTDKNVFQCHGCPAKGSVVDWVMTIEGCDFKTACDRLGVDERKTDTPKKPQNTPYKPPPAKPAPLGAQEPDYKPEKRYVSARHEYKDSDGNLKYTSIRYDYPDGTKSFILAQRTEGGADVMNMKGVQRIPYMYEDFAKTDILYFVEGEKCVDAMTALGLPATTICGGSKAWIDEYAIYFKDKELILIPDNDDTGRKFMQQVAKACKDTATSIKILDLFPEDDYEPKWDIADEVTGMSDGEINTFTMELSSKALVAPVFVRGVQIDGSTPEQLDVKLLKRYQSWQDGGLDLKQIFPVLRDREIRPLVGGDVMVVNGGTGSGKTAFVQNVTQSYDEAPIPWFTLELSETRMHERNIILSNELSGDEVEQRILAGEHLDTRRFNHIHIYDKCDASIDYISEQIKLMPLKTGVKPRVAVVDYVQLMPANHPAMNTTQQVSHNATQLKVLAKKHDIVIIMLSQIGRKEEANLGSGKGTSAIEESATVLIGLNPVEGYSDIRSLGVYKNSNGEAFFTENIGWEGRYYKFSCDATHRQIMNDMEAENDRNDDDTGTDMPF